MILTTTVDSCFVVLFSTFQMYNTYTHNLDLLGLSLCHIAPSPQYFLKGRESGKKICSASPSNKEFCSLWNKRPAWVITLVECSSRSVPDTKYYTVFIIALSILTGFICGIPS